MFIGCFLNQIKQLFEFIFGKFWTFLGFFSCFVGIAPQIANLYFGLFGPLLYLFDQLLPAFFTEFRNRNSQKFAVIYRIKAEVRGENCFFSRFNRRGIPGLNNKQARFRSCDSGQVAQTGRSAVIINHNIFNKRRRGFPGTDAVKVGLHGFFAISYLCFKGF